jgi:hypothetical protein
VPIDEVLPPSHRAWRDNWERVGYEDGSTGCTVGCVAETEEEARRLLSIKFLEQTGDYYAKRFNAWVTAGRPVNRLDYECNSFADLRVILRQALEKKAVDDAADELRRAEQAAQWKREQEEAAEREAEAERLKQEQAA